MQDPSGPPAHPTRPEGVREQVLRYSPPMIELLVSNPLVLLFAVLVIGYPLGRIRIGGVSLGVASVLFVGLALGGLDPEMKLPELVYQLGLVLFVYTVGLSNGPGFFHSFRRRGLRDNLFVAGMLVFAAALSVGVGRLLHLRASLAGGVFAGSLTNTPALAALLETIKASWPPAERAAALADPVVGYSVTYPVGVVGMILAIALSARIWKVDYAREAEGLRSLGGSTGDLASATIRVIRAGAGVQPVSLMVKEQGWDVAFGRVFRAGHALPILGETRFQPGDLVTVVGSEEDLLRVTEYLGEASRQPVDLDRGELDYRRIFVSSAQAVGRKLRDLDLGHRFGAVVTRLRRGDVEFVPHGDTVLEPGDRVRVLTRRETMPAVTRFFGDSYRALSEVDIPTFSLGLGLGLLLGLVPIPLPGGFTFHLGLAGGPLVVALILGARGRTGPMLWALPYSANLTLRQAGLVLFLAGIGTRAGGAFFHTLHRADGLLILLAGTLVTCSTAILALWIGHRRLGIPMSLLSGMMGGLQTQPAVLAFASEQTRNELPNLGYATVYPTAIVLKIILAQIVLMAMR
jgi:putative transport protein